MGIDQAPSTESSSMIDRSDDSAAMKKVTDTLLQLWSTFENQSPNAWRDIS
jgi:hypothetical protein